MFLKKLKYIIYINEDHRERNRKRMILALIFLLLFSTAGGTLGGFWGKIFEVTASQTILVDKGQEEQEIDKIIEIQFNRKFNMNRLRYEISSDFEPEKDWSLTLSPAESETTFYLGVIVPKFSAMPHEGKSLKLHEQIFVDNKPLIDETFDFFVDSEISGIVPKIDIFSTSVEVGNDIENAASLVLGNYRGSHTVEVKLLNAMGQEIPEWKIVTKDVNENKWEKILDIITPKDPVGREVDGEIAVFVDTYKISDFGIQKFATIPKPITAAINILNTSCTLDDNIEEAAEVIIQNYNVGSLSVKFLDNKDQEIANWVPELFEKNNEKKLLVKLNVPQIPKEEATGKLVVYCDDKIIGESTMETFRVDPKEIITVFDITETACVLGEDINDVGTVEITNYIGGELSISFVDKDGIAIKNWTPSLYTTNENEAMVKHIKLITPKDAPAVVDGKFIVECDQVKIGESTLAEFRVNVGPIEAEFVLDQTKCEFDHDISFGTLKLVNYVSGEVTGEIFDKNLQKLAKWSVKLTENKINYGEKEYSVVLVSPKDDYAYDPFDVVVKFYVDKKEVCQVEENITQSPPLYTGGIALTKSEYIGLSGKKFENIGTAVVNNYIKGNIVMNFVDENGKILTDWKVTLIEKKTNFGTKKEFTIDVEGPSDRDAEGTGFLRLSCDRWEVITSTKVTFSLAKMPDDVKITDFVPIGDTVVGEKDGKTIDSAWFTIDNADPKDISVVLVDENDVVNNDWKLETVYDESLKGYTSNILYPGKNEEITLSYAIMWKKIGLIWKSDSAYSFMSVTGIPKFENIKYKYAPEVAIGGTIKDAVEYTFNMIFKKEESDYSAFTENAEAQIDKSKLSTRKWILKLGTGGWSVLGEEDLGDGTKKVHFKANFDLVCPQDEVRGGVNLFYALRFHDAQGLPLQNQVWFSETFVAYKVV